MPGPRVDEFVISACSPGDADRALQVLHGGLPRHERQAMIASQRQWLQDEPTAGTGLYVARGQGEICGAVLVQQQPGRTAILWAPGSSPADPAVEARLAQAADKHLAARGPVLAQSLLADSSDPKIAVLEGIGFTRLTELEYLVAEARPAETDGRPEPLTFEAYRPAERQRLARVVEATYIDTLDCPQLDGTRDIDDVITGYQATGEFDPEKWFFVVQDGQDVGVVLLSEHSGASQWELVYMGLVPQARGRGLGQAMVEDALHRAWTARVESILLAVDTDNRHAVELYRRLGFRVWNRRVVYWKMY